MLRTTNAIIQQPSSVALVSLERVKTELGITDDSLNYWLSQKILDGSDAVEAFLNRRLPRAKVCDTIRSDQCLTLLQLSRTPVLSVESIVADGITLTTSPQAVQWELDAGPGQIERVENDRPYGWTSRKIVVTYTGGYDLPNDRYEGADAGIPLPREVQQAMLELMRLVYLDKGRNPHLRAEEAPGLGRLEYQTEPTAGDLMRDLPASVTRWITNLRDLRI